VLADRKEEGTPIRKQASLDAIARAIEHSEGVEKETLRSGTRVRAATKARKVFSLVARGMGHAVKVIAAYLSVDGATVSGYESERAELVEQAVKIKRESDKISFGCLTPNATFYFKLTNAVSYCVEMN
jgi:FixJ family two-component response regulator